MAKDNFIRSHVYIANLWRIYPSAAGSQNIPGLLWKEIFCYCACSSLPWVTKSQPTFIYPMCFRSTLILSHHSHLDLHNSVFPSGLPTNNSYFLGPSCMPQCPSTNHLFNLTVLIISCVEYNARTCSFLCSILPVTFCLLYCKGNLCEPG
jgi:hypothetical protein